MTDERSDVDFMTRALAAARQGETRPNPRVGAVVVKDGVVLQTGFHRCAGMPHAEVEALAGLTVSQTQGATLFVSLEPCNHHGRTPPCSEAVIASQVARVVIGCADPAPHVAGSIERLRHAGIEVTVGVCEKQARLEVADFCKLLTTGMPYVALKAAMTLDGRLCSASGDSKWITGQEARAAGHRLRAESDAIIVGIGTVVADDPQLTVRHVEGKSPTRVIFDSHLRTPLEAQVLSGEPDTLLMCLDSASERTQAQLEAKGARVVRLRDLRVQTVLRELGRRNHMRVMVEGGPTLLNAFLQTDGCVDELHAFVAPKLLGNGPSLYQSDQHEMASTLDLAQVTVCQFGPDTRIRGALSSFATGTWTAPLPVFNHTEGKP